MKKKEIVEVCSLCNGDETFDHSKCHIICNRNKWPYTKKTTNPDTFPTCPFCRKNMTKNNLDLICIKCKYSIRDDGNIHITGNDGQNIIIEGRTKVIR